MGRFCVPSCRQLELETDVILHNTYRDTDSQEDRLVKQAPLLVDLIILVDGEIQFSCTEYKTVPFGKTVTIFESDFKDVLSKNKECVFVCSTYYRNVSKSYIQEHQVVYKNTAENKLCTVLYDEFPIYFPKQGVINPIVLLAHKIWLSKSLNTVVVLTNVNVNELSSDSKNFFKVSLLNSRGQVVLNKQVHVYNETVVLDLKEDVNKLIKLNEEPLLFSLVAKGGGDGCCVINTVMINENSKSLAVEHSLPPYYYVTGDRERIRSEALEGVV